MCITEALFNPYSGARGKECFRGALNLKGAICMKRIISAFLAVLLLLVSAPLTELANIDWSGAFAPRASAYLASDRVDIPQVGERFDISYDFYGDISAATYRFIPQVNGIYVMSVYPRDGSRYSISRLNGSGATVDYIHDAPYSCYLEKGRAYYFEFRGENSKIDGEAAITYVENSIQSTRNAEDIKSVTLKQGYDLIVGIDTDAESILDAVVASIEFESGEIFDYYFGYSYKYYDYPNFLNETYYLMTHMFNALDFKIAGFGGELDKPGKVTVDFAFNDVEYDKNHIKFNNASLEMNVIENPIESIEYVGDDLEVLARDAKSRTDPIYGEELGDVTYVTYDAFEEIEQIRSIKINYADGTCAFATGNSGTAFDGYSASYFLFNNIAPCLETHLNNRDQISFVTNQVLNPWKFGNTYTVTVKYMKKTTEYNVRIVNNPSVVKENRGYEDCFILNAGESAVFTFTPSKNAAYNLVDIDKELEDGYYEISCKDDENNVIPLESFLLNNRDDEAYADGFRLRKNKTYTFELKNNQDEQISLNVIPYKIPTDCIHIDVTFAAAVEATCSKPGFTAGKYCNDCQEWIEGHEKIIVPHVDENKDDICDVCSKILALKITNGETVHIEVAEGETVLLRFVPQEDGIYDFVSNSDRDTYGYLFDSEKNIIDEDDESAQVGSNFKVTHSLTAGTVYYWGAKYFDSSSSGSFDVSLSMRCKHKNAEERAEVKATCTERGYTAGVFCPDCGEWVSGHAIIEPRHVDKNNDNICDVCSKTIYQTISAGESIAVSVPRGTIAFLRFVPEKSGTYIFKSILDFESAERIDPYGYAYNSDMIPFEYNDDDPNGSDYNFLLSLNLKAGQVYFLGIKTRYLEETEVTVSLTAENVHEHIEVIDEAKAATCTETGLTEGKHCSACGEVIVTQTEIPALGHTKSDWITDKDSTCTVGGTKHKECTVCHVTLETENIPVKSHTYESVVTAPTCTTEGYTTHICSVCGDSYVDEKVGALGHTEVIDAARDATCTETGLTDGKHCSACGEVIVAQTETPALGHTAVTDKAVAATCTKAGKTKGSHCSVCGEVLTAQKTVSALGHKYKTATTKATTSKNGKTVTACTVCGKVKKTTVIYKASSVKLSKTSYTYNGKAQKPTVTVKTSNGTKLKEGRDYTVKYQSGRKTPGKYTVTVTFKGNYSGKKTLTFTIAPKAPTLKVKAGAKKATLSWNKQTGATGYTVYMATSKNGKYKKLTTLKGNKLSYTKTGLTKGKTYYFKVAAYTTSGKTQITGAYSSVKSVKVK